MAKKVAKNAAGPPAKKATKKVGKGTRYPAAMKEKVVSFVKQVNESKGRGGVAEAARKFGVSPLSIGNWVKKEAGGELAIDGRTTAGKAKAKARGGAKASAKNGRDGILGELTSLNREISKKRRELDSLESRFETLKGAL